MSTPLSAAEEGRAGPKRSVQTKDHHHHVTRHMHAHHRRKARREAAMKKKMEKDLPGMLRGGTIEQSRKRLSMKNEAIAALAEFCGTFCE